MRCGWIPDLPDARDVTYDVPEQVRSAGLPERVDLRADCPPVQDQGQLESCTAHAIGAAIEFDQAKQELPDRFTPSRLFIYYWERWLEDKVESNTGVMLRNGVKVINRAGAPPESLWPYDPDPVSGRFKEEPSQAASDAARHQRAVSYQRIARDVDDMKACLASGYPFMFGFTVYERFESDEVRRTGRASMPRPAERAVTGHAVLAVGYVDSDQRFLVRNSWGSDWGMDGYFTMPYAYLLQRSLARDFWTIRVLGDGPHPRGA
jgi:C1A family cysteine protease